MFTTKIKVFGQIFSPQDYGLDKDNSGPESLIWALETNFGPHNRYLRSNIQILTWDKRFGASSLRGGDLPVC